MSTPKDSKLYRQRHPDRCKAQIRAWRAHNIEKVKLYNRRANLKRYYGITIDDYDRMYKKQKGKCFLCKTKWDRLHVDHCHKTGKIRKLLCNACNRVILGKIENCRGYLSRLINYLEFSR